MGSVRGLGSPGLGEDPLIVLGLVRLRKRLDEAQKRDREVRDVKTRVRLD